MLFSNNIFALIKKKEKEKKILFILSGGKSVKEPYKLLSNMVINWKNSEAVLVDERISQKKKFLNESMLNKFFFNKKAKNVKFFRFEPKEKVNNEILNQLKKKIVSSFSIAIIGFGNDGHIASIFEKMDNFSKIADLKKTPKLIITEKIGKPHLKRISFNLSMILLSNMIYLVIGNKKKLNYLKNINRNKLSPLYRLIKNKKNIIYIYKNKIYNLIK